MGNFESKMSKNDRPFALNIQNLFQVLMIYKDNSKNIILSENTLSENKKGEVQHEQTYPSTKKEDIQISC